ncbi:MAG: hypothetical protein HY827_08775 [Actinobacteria bacterium]|nr:hypothetical protein [Actinomycetota bacterium]
MTQPLCTKSEFDRRLLFVGDDPDGVALEVMAIELDAEEALLVIHAMPLRDRYRPYYERVKLWTK